MPEAMIAKQTSADAVAHGLASRDGAMKSSTLCMRRSDCEVVLNS